MKKLNDLGWLKQEFESMEVQFNSLHDDMQINLDGYKYNFFYAPRPGMSQPSRTGVNLAQLFLDKLWYHTSEFPKINVPSSPEDNQNAEMREKIVLATHQKNGCEQLWGDWTFDGGAMGMAVAITLFDVKKRCVTIDRVDPRRVWYQKADSNNDQLEVLWTAVPMTKTAIQRRYGVTPTGGEGMTYDMLSDGNGIPQDNEDYYLVINRYDDESHVRWVGHQFLLKPYKHLQGGIPADIAMPIKVANFDNLPSFYLDKLKDLQAEFNELWRRRANVVRKLGNPLVYGRGIYKQNEADVKEQLQGDGGFVSLKENGELALLTIPETKMIDTALSDCFQKMKDVAGFPTATFGEVVGANTSGDALGMYFTPTQKMVNHYNKAYKAFLSGINTKILRGYDMFAKIDEQFSLNGYMTNGSVRSGDNEKQTRKGQAYEVTFTKENIGHNYLTVVTPGAVTPKDDIQYKRFILDAVTNKFMSRQTGLDEIGVLSPEDEFKRLQTEQSDPMLNPEGASAVAQFDPGARLEQDNPLPAGVEGGIEEQLPVGV